MLHTVRKIAQFVQYLRVGVLIPAGVARAALVEVVAHVGDDKVEQTPARGVDQFPVDKLLPHHGDLLNAFAQLLCDGRAWYRLLTLLYLGHRFEVCELGGGQVQQRWLVD